MRSNRSRPYQLVALVAALLCAHAAQAQDSHINLSKRGRPARIKVAVYPVVNEAGAGNDALAAAVGKSLETFLRHSPYFSVWTPAGQLPKDQHGMLQAAQSAGANWALVTRLTRVGTVQIKKGKEANLVEVASAAWSVASESQAMVTYARAQSDMLPKGVKFTGSEQLVQMAVAETAEQLTEGSQMYGIVISRVEGGQVRISLGGLDHLRNKAAVQFGRGNDIIGMGEVIEVDDQQALVNVKPRFAFQRLEVNTPVSVVYNPPSYAAGLSYKEISARRERVDEIEFSAAIVMAVLGIFVFKPIIDRNLFP